MGKAIAGAIAGELADSELLIIDPRAQDSFSNENIKLCSSVSEIGDFQANIVIFAVKPQNIKEVMAEFANWVNKDAIIISILAGTTVSIFKETFPQNKIVRVMPNLGAIISKSVNLAYSEDGDVSFKEKIGALLKSFGCTVWLNEESQLHAGTAVSGSGPAYYYLFLKIYAKYLENAGYEAEAAQEIAIETAEAASQTAKGQNLDQLIKNVTSKGGTTEAALNVLDDDLERLINESLDAAASRSVELSS